MQERKALELLNRQKLKKGSNKWFQRIHHILMIKYGWIPFEEFKKLPLPTLWNLLDEIKADYEAEKKETDKMKNRRK